jgi:hypothetical protein
MQKAMSREVLPPMDGVGGVGSFAGSAVHLPQIHGAQGGSQKGIAMENGGHSPHDESSTEGMQRKKSLGLIELPPVHMPAKQQVGPLDMGDSIYSPGEYPLEHMQAPHSPDSNPGGTYTTQYVEPEMGDDVDGAGQSYDMMDGDGEGEEGGFAPLEGGGMEQQELDMGEA